MIKQSELTHYLRMIEKFGKKKVDYMQKFQKRQNYIFHNYTYDQPRLYSLIKSQNVTKTVQHQPQCKSKHASPVQSVERKPRAQEHKFFLNDKNEEKLMKIEGILKANKFPYVYSINHETKNDKNQNLSEKNVKDQQFPNKRQKILKLSKFKQQVNEQQSSSRKYQNFIDLEENDEKIEYLKPIQNEIKEGEQKKLTKREKNVEEVSKKKVKRKIINLEKLKIRNIELQQ